jgi:hypothetical protein
MFLDGDRLTCPCCGAHFETPARPWNSIFAAVMHHFAACPSGATLTVDLRRAVAADLATQSAHDDTHVRLRRLARTA